MSDFDFTGFYDAVKQEIKKGRRTITRELSELLEQYLNPHHDPRIYMAKEVSVNFGHKKKIVPKEEKPDINTDEWGRVDYMRFQPVNNSVSGIEKGDFYCYEIKSCADDLMSGYGRNFFGDYNYFVMSKDLWEEKKELLSSLFGIGVLIPEGNSLVAIQKAHRMDRKYPASFLLLCMFRSANRENVKNRDLMIDKK